VRAPRRIGFRAVALSDDQKAMLRLLAQREQGYEDLAALMGLSVDEVRAKVKDALAQLEQGEEAPPLPPEPPAPAPPAEEPPAPVESAPAAEEPASPPPPKAPPEPKPAPAAEPAVPPPPAAAAKPKRPGSQPPRLSLPAGNGARAAIAAGVAVVILVIVVLAVSGGGSGSGSTTAGTTPTAAAESEAEGAAQTTPTVDGKEVTEAKLSAVDGSDASGTAIFGRVKNSLALQVEASGLAQPKQGQAYTIWLAQSPQKMLPLASTDEVKGGKIGAQFEVPTEVLSYLANETFGQLAVTLTSTPLLKASLAKATKEKKAPIYTGTEVLRGTIVGPIVGAAEKEKKK